MSIRNKFKIKIEKHKYYSEHCFLGYQITFAVLWISLMSINSGLRGDRATDFLWGGIYAVWISFLMFYAGSHWNSESNAVAELLEKVRHADLSYPKLYLKTGCVAVVSFMFAFLALWGVVSIERIWRGEKYIMVGYAASLFVPQLLGCVYCMKKVPIEFLQDQIAKHELSTKKDSNDENIP